MAAVLRLEPAIDFQQAQYDAFHGVDDQAVLQRAAELGRILVTHDKGTMPGQLADFLAESNSSPGVIIVIPQDAPIREVAETLVLIWGATKSDEWANRIEIIPW